MAHRADDVINLHHTTSRWYTRCAGSSHQALHNVQHMDQSHVVSFSTIGRKSLGGYKRRITVANKRNPPAKLAGGLRYAELGVLRLIDHELQDIAAVFATVDHLVCEMAYEKYPQAADLPMRQIVLEHRWGQ